MALPIENDSDVVPPLKSFVSWVRRILILGCLVWALFSVQIYSEDALSHTIKATYPLLLGHEKILYRASDYDPTKARWTPLNLGVPIRDAQIFFIHTGKATYAVQMLNQQSTPDTATYVYLKVNDGSPVVKGMTHEFPGGIRLPGCEVGWSGRGIGAGFIYPDEAFIRGKTPAFEIGTPFQSGDLDHYRKTIPPNVHFESLPWKMEKEAEQIIPAG